MPIRYIAPISWFALLEMGLLYLSVCVQMPKKYNGITK